MSGHGISEGISEGARLSSTASLGGGGGKPLYILGLIPLDFNAVGQFALQAAAPLGKPIPSLLQPIGKSGSIADKLLQAIQNIPDDLKSKLSNAGILHQGTGSPHVDHGLGGMGRSSGPMAALDR